MADAPRRRPQAGWVCAWILLGLYLILKITGLWYGMQVRAVDRKIQELRPTLANILLFKRMEETKAACQRSFDQIRQMDLQGDRFLQQLSHQLPPSITVQRLELDPETGVWVRGTCMAGIRNPEEVILRWAQRLQESTQPTVRLKGLVPDRQIQGLWHFELRGSKDG